MKNVGLKASWLLSILLAVCGLFISGLTETAPDAEAESDVITATSSALEITPSGSPSPAAGGPAPASVTSAASASTSDQSGASEMSGTASAPSAAGQESGGETAASATAAAPSGPELTKLSVSQSGRIRSNGCLTDEAAIEDMQKLKADLEEKTKALAKRETELQQKEAALAEELKKIEVVRDEIKQANQISIGKNEEKINKLVETFESMSPKAAALLVANIEQSLAVASLSKISSPKLAKILAAMDPEQSGSLTEALAGVVRVSGKPSSPKAKSASNGAAATTPHPGKGGENEYGNQNQRNERQPASREPSPATGQ